MKTNFEPFRTKVVEQIRITDLDGRKELLKKACYNLFKIPSSAITIDLLSDSGTGCLEVINKRKDKVMGFKITKNYDFLRHFLADLNPAGKSKRLEHSKS